MLANTQRGYAVMNKSLDTYSFEDMDFKTCKKYCRNGDVIIEQIPYAAGFSIKIVWHKWNKPIRLKKRLRYGNILWIHFYWDREYLHKNGRIVYQS